MGDNRVPQAYERARQLDVSCSSGVRNAYTSGHTLKRVGDRAVLQILGRSGLMDWEMLAGRNGYHCQTVEREGCTKAR